MRLLEKKRNEPVAQTYCQCRRGKKSYHAGADYVAGFPAQGEGGTIADNNNAAIQVVDFPNSNYNNIVGEVVNMIDNNVVNHYTKEAAVHDVAVPNNNNNHNVAVGVVITIDDDVVTGDEKNGKH